MLSLLQTNIYAFVSKTGKLLWTIITLLLLSFCMLACEDKNEPEGEIPGDTDTPDGPGDRNEDHVYPTDQTVFIYMPWSNNLTSYFLTNILDLKSALTQELLQDKQVIVYFNSSPTNAYLYEIKYRKGECINDTLRNYTDLEFTTAEGIASVLEDVKKYASAPRYSMVIGCHGMGWIPVSSANNAKARRVAEREYWEYENEGALLTRWFGGTEPAYQTDITTLAEAITNAGIKMEYILFDDCYMSSIELAYDLKDVTDYLIASPCEIMAYGMPYAEIGKYMFGDVDYEGIANAFLDFYKNYKTPCGTIAVTVCSEMDNLAAIMKKINNEYEFDTSLLNSIQRLDGYSPIRFFDYGDYVSFLCQDDDLLSEFEAQLERTVPSACRKHTDYFYTMNRGSIRINTYSGITVSDPSVSSYTSAKTETAWYRATH